MLSSSTSCIGSALSAHRAHALRAFAKPDWFPRNVHTFQGSMKQEAADTREEIA